MGQSKLSPVLQFLAIAFLGCSSAGAAEINDRMSIVEAIESVREQGFDVSYSSLLVEPWMRVRFTPEDTDPLHALQQVLAEYDLALEDSPGPGWLIVRGERPVKPRTFAVRGRIIDASSGAPVAGARVTVAGRQIVSGADGVFEITDLSGGNRNLQIVADGYVSLRRELANPDTASGNVFALERVTLPNLEEITIVASRYSVFSSDGASSQFLSGDEIRLLPHVADDAFRVLHKLPGVASSDFQAPFNLRGGASDEVKIVIDGLELFEPYHMRTLYSPLSIIDPGIIGQVQMLSGGFTAEYGNHMSGVVDIDSIWPSGAPVHQLGVSFVNAFARSSGAFSGNWGTYQFSARRGYLDLVADQIVDEGEELSPRYSDIFASVNYRLSDSVDLSARVLTASDDVNFLDAFDGEDFGGESSLDYVWLSIDAEPRDGMTIRNMIFAGRVDTVEDGGLANFPFESIDRFFHREIDVSGIDSNISWQISDSVMWKLGARYRSLSADYDYKIDSLRQTDLTNDGVPYTLVRDIVTSRDGDEYGAHAAVRFRTSDQLTWELGLRWDKQTYTTTDDDLQVSPRINAVYTLSDRTEIRLGWGAYYQPQGIQDLQVQDGVTDFFPAQKAEHRVIGFRHRRVSGLELQVDVYEKIYSDVRPRYENALDLYEFAPESNFDRIRIAPDSAEARGVELTVRNRQSKALDWWLNYTWSEAEDVIGDVSIRRSWDQRHAVTGNVIWRGEKWNLSIVARYHSGWPRTPLLLLPKFDGIGGFTGAGSDLSQRNREDYDDYSRVDLRLSRTVLLEKSNFEYYFEIYNLFDSVNQCCVESHTLQIGPSVVASPNVDDFLPFFPSFGFVWTFGPGVGRE